VGFCKLLCTFAAFDENNQIFAAFPAAALGVIYIPGSSGVRVGNKNSSGVC